MGGGGGAAGAGGTVDWWVASDLGELATGRALRTAIFHIVRQRLTPSASDPSSQPGRTERRPSEKIETTSGAIITVRIRTAATRL